jgi:hypothetical protein
VKENIAVPVLQGDKAEALTKLINRAFAFDPVHLRVKLVVLLLNLCPIKNGSFLHMLPPKGSTQIG